MSPKIEYKLVHSVRVGLADGPLRTRSRSVGGDRARPFLSDRSRHITLVYSLVIDHLILH